MNKKISIDKYFILSFFIIILIIFLNFFDFTTYPFSFLNVKKKSDQLLSINNDVRNNVALLSKRQTELADLKNNSNTIDENNKEMLQKFNDIKFELHIPSLLILLEQNANYFKLDSVEIYYNLVKSQKDFSVPNIGSTKPVNAPKIEQGTVNNMKTSSSETSKQNKSNSQTTNLKENSEQSSTTTKNENAQDSDNITFDKIDYTYVKNLVQNQNVAINSNLSTTIVPLRIQGNYDNVKSYLKFLENVDFVQPYFIKMNSSGNKIDAVILLYIFSKPEEG